MKRNIDLYCDNVYKPDTTEQKDRSFGFDSNSINIQDNKVLSKNTEDNYINSRTQIPALFTEYSDIDDNLLLKRYQTPNSKANASRLE